jgi:ribosome hibernation promoting factor
MRKSNLTPFFSDRSSAGGRREGHRSLRRRRAVPTLFLEPGAPGAREHARTRRASVVRNTVTKESLMNLQLTGHHVDITPALRDYVRNKLERVTRHFDHVIDVSVVLTVDKLQQKVEATVHVRGKDLHASSIEPDMYAAIDMLADKLDRQIVKHKEKLTGHRVDNDKIERAAAPPAESA